MLGIGSLIGAGLSLGSTILGGIKAKKAAKKVSSNIEGQRRRNEEWYNRRYNEDATQRADAQRVLTMTAERMRAANRQAAAAAAVTGGSEESAAAAKAASSQAMADAASQIAAAGAARKDAVEQQYRAADQQYLDRLNGIETGKMQATAQAAAAAAQTGAGIANLIDNTGEEDEAE